MKLFGRVVELIENKKLAFTWQEDGATDQEKNPLLLTMELEPENGGTRVKLSHSGFDLLPSDMVEKTFRSYQNGWSDAQELPRLKAAVLAEMVNV